MLDVGTGMLDVETVAPQLIRMPSGCGLVAVRHAVAGETVFDITDSIALPERDYRTIEVDGRHLLHPLVRFMNHSCDPSCQLLADGDGQRFAAIAAIRPGDQLTFDYETTESAIVRPFDCQCGSPVCRGRVG